MRYLSLILLSAGVAYAGGSMEFYGGSVTSLCFDSTGNSTTPELSSSTYGLKMSYSIFSTPIPMSPKLNAVLDFKYLSVDTSSSKVINLLLEGKVPFITVRAGVNLDMASTSTRFFDGHNALLMGASVGIPFVNASLDYAYTFPENGMDPGDVLIFRTGGGLKVGLGEFAYVKAGLDVLYRKIFSPDGGYNLSILPYAGVKFTSIAVDLILGYEDEYGYYGVSLSGKNAPATGLGTHLRLKYYF